MTDGRKRARQSWQGMLQRCGNPACKNWMHYGGRGIKVCERWQVFENFLADMSERPEGLTLDRIDNDGNYEPGNCRWATQKQQRWNQRPGHIHLIEINGETKPMIDWARQYGMAQDTVLRRMQAGMGALEALTTPINEARRDACRKGNARRWASRQEPARYEFQGKSLTALEWAQELGWPRTTVARRFERGWSVEKALTVPVRPRSCVSLATKGAEK